MAANANPTAITVATTDFKEYIAFSISLNAANDWLPDTKMFGMTTELKYRSALMQIAPRYLDTYDVSFR